MADTIELLESIGADAGLRHASTGDLEQALALACASEALKAAVRSGDSSLLDSELGYRSMQLNHDVHTGGREDEPCDDEPMDEPGKTPDPEQDEPSRDG